MGEVRAAFFRSEAVEEGANPSPRRLDGAFRRLAQSGFARAATDLDEVEGILVRLEREGEKIHAIEYAEDDLNSAAEQGIEVR